MLIQIGSPRSIGHGAQQRCSGDLAGSGTEQVPVGSRPEAARVGEVRAPPAPGEPHASFGLEGFGGSGVVLLA
jgi:hypothetical protein